MTNETVKVNKDKTRTTEDFILKNRVFTDRLPVNRTSSDSEWNPSAARPEQSFISCSDVQELSVMLDVVVHEGVDEEVAVVVTLKEETTQNASNWVSAPNRSKHITWPWTGWRSTDRLQPEDHGDLLLGADGDQVVGQQLAGRQELVIAALVDQDVELRTRVGRRQHGGIVRLKTRGGFTWLVDHRCYRCNYTQHTRDRLPPRWTCPGPGTLRRPSVPRDTAQGYRSERRQRRPGGDRHVSIITWWCHIPSNPTSGTLYFPGFFRAQTSAPWPPMEWPLMDILSGAVGKLALISLGSWDRTTTPVSRKY